MPTKFPASLLNKVIDFSLDKSTQDHRLVYADGWKIMLSENVIKQITEELKNLNPDSENDEPSEPARQGFRMFRRPEKEPPSPPPPSNQWWDEDPLHAIGPEYIKEYGHETQDLNESVENAVGRLKVHLEKSARIKRRFWRDGVATAIENLQQLVKTLPNFSEPIKKIEESLLLASVLGRRDAPRPILLIGPPGCGKTNFARELSSALGIGKVSFDCSKLDAAFPISGTSPNWGRADCSNIAKHIAKQNNDSGLIFIDEINLAANIAEERYAVLPALYSLLDIDQAKEFRDLCLSVHFDLSGWFKIAATNDRSGLSSALLDRFDVVQVHPPTKEQRFVIVQKMALESGFDFQDRHIEALNEQSGSLRKLAAAVRQATINAARRCDREIIDLDIQRLRIQKCFEPA